MLRRPRRALGAILTTCVLAAAAGRAPAQVAPDSTEGAQIRDMVCAAAHVETFRIFPQRIVREDEWVNVGGYPVDRQGADADSASARALCGLIASAVRQGCTTRSDCAFFPTYGLRFAGLNPPLEMVVSPDCWDWLFIRDGAVLGSAPTAWCVRDSLAALMKRIFPESR